LSNGEKSSHTKKTEYAARNCRDDAIFKLDAFNIKHEAAKGLTNKNKPPMMDMGGLFSLKGKN
jgi:hypothetical protein